MTRVLILGGPGSGKTTLARRLAAALHAPHTELDRIAHDPPPGREDAPFWQWTKAPDATRRARADALAASDRWVADGLYAGWTAGLRDAAEVVIWLDPPTRVAVWRVVRRAVRDRWRGGSDWDLRSVRRVVRGARDFRRRPAGTAGQLRDRDGANGTRTLEAFLAPVTGKVVRCRTARQTRDAVERLGAGPPGGRASDLDRR